MEAKRNTPILAQWIHEAAREGRQPTTESEGPFGGFCEIHVDVGTPTNKGTRSLIRFPYLQTLEKGAVPLCEDDIWKPKETQLSSHSGFMRQPAKEGSPRRKGRARLGDPVKCLLIWGHNQIRGNAPYSSFPSLVCIVMVHPC